MDRPAFLNELYRRHNTGESLSSLSRSLSVSHVAVFNWLNGTRKPSRLVLAHAALVWGGATDLPAGLAGADPKKPG